MDIISHTLIGRALAASPKNSKRDIFIICFFAYLPDLPQLVTYIYLGLENSRRYLFPLTSDWNGLRAASPIWSALWEVPHGLIFLLVIILPIVLYFKITKMAFWAYAVHLIIDWFTHSGEWAVNILYPFASYKIEGFTDAWAWSIEKMLLSWILILVLIKILTLMLNQKKRANLLKRLRSGLGLSR